MKKALQIAAVVAIAVSLFGIGAMFGVMVDLDNRAVVEQVGGVGAQAATNMDDLTLSGGLSASDATLSGDMSAASITLDSQAFVSATSAITITGVLTDVHLIYLQN